MKLDPKSTFDNQEFENYIDLKYILGVFLRNKIFILSLSTLFFILSCLYAITKKRVWEGDFKIVLNLETSNNTSIMSAGLAGISNLTGINFGGKAESSLKTQVGILESPSILMPVYEFVKNEKEKKYPGKNFETFRDWEKDFLSINLQKGTSILDISYRDTEKDHIIPALNKMTEVYQSYSGKANRRNIELTKKYLKNQIQDYKNKVDSSIKIAQDYAIDQDLSIVDVVLRKGGNSFLTPFNSFEFNTNTLNNSGGSGNFNLGSSVNVEVARVKAANEIKKIELTLEKIKNISDEDKNIAFLSYLVPELSLDGTLQDLKEIDSLIYDLKSRYKNNYKPLLKAKQQREAVFDQIKETAIAYLKSKKISSEATYKSALRPKEVLLKYKQLVREAKRDEATLIQLEDLYRTIQLKEAKIEDPWELITKPRLKEKSVAPRRKNIALLGGLLGLVIGYLISIFKEQKSKIIYSVENLELLLDSKVLKEFNISNSNYLLDLEDFISEIKSLSSNDELKILVSQTFYESQNEKIKQLTNQKNMEVISLNQISNFKKSNIVLLTSIGLVTKKEINEVNQRLEIINKKLFGIILF